MIESWKVGGIFQTFYLYEQVLTVNGTLTSRVPNNTLWNYEVSNELCFHGLQNLAWLSPESLSVAEQYALNIYLLLRDIPVLKA